MSKGEGSPGNKRVSVLADGVIGKRSLRGAVQSTREGLAPVAIAADEVALARASSRREESPCCDVCSAPVSAEDLHGGLFVWSRSGETVIDEPPVCASCGSVLGISLLRALRIRDESEG